MSDVETPRKKTKALHWRDIPHRDWCFTDYNLDTEWLKGLPVSFICWGYELGEKNETPHLQSFLSIQDEMSFNEVKRLLMPDPFYVADRHPAGWKPIHFERRGGTVMEAIGYCLKDYGAYKDGALDPTWTLDHVDWTNENCFRLGERPPDDDPKVQGKRSDMDFARTLVKLGMGLKDFTELCRSHQALRLFKDLLIIYEQPRHIKPTVLWIWGNTFTGKTTFAMNWFEARGISYARGNLHKQRLDEEHFEGYDGQEGLYIDEFDDTKYSFKFMVELMNEPMRVRMLYGSRQMMATSIVISANRHYRECWEHVRVGNSPDYDIGHVERRITYIKHCKPDALSALKRSVPIEIDDYGIQAQIQEIDAEALD